MRDLIEAHLAHCRYREFSRVTIRDRGELLRRIHADLPFGLYEATVEELADWLAGPAEPPFWSAQTKSTYYTHVTGFYRWASSETVADGLDYDPSAALVRPRVPPGLPNPVSDEEMARILGEAAGKYRIWAVLAGLAGCRAGEIANLRREDVTQDNLKIIRGKWGRSRNVPTHPEVWRSVCDLPPGPIARRVDRLPADAQYVSSRSLTYFGDVLHMPGVGLHRLRHWFGTTTYRITKDLRVVQELMGHASPRTTALYTLVTSEERRAAIQALPTLAAAG